MAKGNGTASLPAKQNGQHEATSPAHEQDGAARFKALLEKARPQIEGALPRHLTPERMMQVARTAVYRTPKLQECDPMTVVAAIVQASELGLEPVGSLGHGYLVPRWNKNARCMEATFLPGYRGLLELARRSGQIASVQARVVYEGDDFDFEYGMEPRVRHKPHLGKRGAVVAAYATAKLKGGETALEVMSVEEIDLIRARSQSKDFGPWVTDYSEMARKTVLRRLLKLLPCSVELTRAFEIDNVDYEAPEASVQLRSTSGTRSAQLAARIGALPAPEPEFEEGTNGEIRCEADDAEPAGDDATTDELPLGREPGSDDA
jgi:recombination protein RecT